MKTDFLRIELAKEVASRYHANQVRKYTAEPYINHLAAVAGKVRGLYPPDLEVVAWLHDTVEDTECTLEIIEGLFGAKVADCVAVLTDPPKEMGNRALRKVHICEKFMDCKPLDVRFIAHTVKVADILDNVRTIVKHDPGFAKVYLQEKLMLLPCLSSANVRFQIECKVLLREEIEKLEKITGEENVTE